MIKIPCDSAVPLLGKYLIEIHVYVYTFPNVYLKGRDIIYNLQYIIYNLICNTSWGLLWWISSKESACNAGNHLPSRDLPWDRKIPGEGNGNPLQCSYLGNPMDRGTWWTTHDLATILPP